MAKNGRYAIHQSLTLGPKGATKSHFAPILGPLGYQCFFLGSKRRFRVPEYCLCVDLEPFVSKKMARGSLHQLTQSEYGLKRPKRGLKCT